MKKIFSLMTLALISLMLVGCGNEERKTFFDDGKIKSIAFYTSDNQLDGDYKLWDEKGELIKHEKYDNGKFLGGYYKDVSEFFDKTWKIKNLNEKKELHGLFQEYFEGDLLTEINYDNGKILNWKINEYEKHIILKETFNDIGTNDKKVVTKVKTYKNGKLEKEYSPLKGNKSFKKGRYGFITNIYWKTREYQDVYYDFNFKFYNENGKLIEEGDFTFNDDNGSYISIGYYKKYDENGKEILNQMFDKNGKEIKK